MENKTPMEKKKQSQNNKSYGGTTAELGQTGKTGYSDKILQRIDVFIKIVEARKSHEKELFSDIDNLIKRVIKENGKYEKEYYWRWQIFMKGYEEIKQKREVPNGK